MSRPRKYRRGRPITTMAALLRELNGRRYIYHQHKPQHFAWCLGWPIGYAQNQIDRRRLFYAKPTNLKEVA